MARRKKALLPASLSHVAARLRIGLDDRVFPLMFRGCRIMRADELGILSLFSCATSAELFEQGRLQGCWKTLNSTPNLFEALSCPQLLAAKSQELQ